MENWLKRNRFFPRIIVAIVLILCVEIAQWFMNLETPNNAQAGFTGAFGLSLVGIVRYYLENKADE